jgi:hypothetical protein
MDDFLSHARRPKSGEVIGDSLDPADYALLYPDPGKFPGRSAEQIAPHALRTLERVFALGLCHMPRSKAAKERPGQTPDHAITSNFHTSGSDWVS